MKNWAGNIDYSTENLVTPSTIEEVQEQVAGASKIKILGSKHSFNTIADSNAAFLALGKLNTIADPDPGTRTVTFGGGVNYGQLATHLQERGWALHNLASLPHISVAGACATATHGSGIKNGNLATALAGMKVVTASGEIREFSRAKDRAEFETLAVHWGAIGALVELTVDIEPTYQVTQWVYENLALETALANLREIVSSGYSVSLFTSWADSMIEQIWVKSRVDSPTGPPETIFGSKRSMVKLHPLPGVDPINCTDQCGIPGTWEDRLSHFRMNFTPSAGEELQTEFFVPFELAGEAAMALNAISSKISPLLFVSEIRFIAADNLAMSPQFGRETVAFHFTWKPDWENVRPVVTEIERALEPFGAAPHMGKLFTMSGEKLAEVYPRLKIFAATVRELDPKGKFANRFLDRNLFAQN